MTTTEERVSRLEGSYEHVATKADIERLEGKMDTSSTALEGKMDTSTTSLEGKMEAMENRLLLKFIGSMALISGLTIAILKFLE